MKKPKGKQTVDLLALPQKERIRLCRKIRIILQQRVSEERNSRRKAVIEKQQPHGRGEVFAKTLKSHFIELSSGGLPN